MTDQLAGILDTMRQAAEHPAKVVEEFKSMTGRPAIGCAPEYCPEEIVYAAGMLPVGLWGGKTAISQAAMYFPAFASPLVQTTLELGMRGVYDRYLSGVIIPTHCDHLKCFGQNWKVAVPQVRFIPMVHPINRQLEAAVPFLKSEYNRIRRTLEEIGGAPVTDEALGAAIDVYNRHRQALRQFTRVTREYPQTVTPVIRHLVIKSGYFMDKALHADLVESLTAQLQQLPPEDWPGKRVLLTGIMAEPNEFLDLFTENGLAVVADDLAQESRQFRVDVPAGGDPLERLARRWSLMDGCSLLYDPNKRRRFLLRDLVAESGADGVVACIMKFCEMEEFDYPIYRKTLEEAGIPLLHLEVDLIGQSLEQARTRIQSFAEMLAAR